MLAKRYTPGRKFRTWIIITSELYLKFKKASTGSECALSVCDQLKVDSELKFPGNERNYKFNLEILDHLESVSAAFQAVQDSAKAF